MAVREGLLALLADGPRHGYQLKTDFEAATGGVWPLNVGQVYTTLDRLERDGYVEVDLAAVAPGQKQYVITPAGVDALGAWWQAVPSDEPPPRDELMLKVLMAVERGPEHALTVITRQRGVLTGLLQAKRRERRALERDGGAGGDTASRLVTEALLARAEADLRWLDTCERTVTERITTERITTERSPS